MPDFNKKDCPLVIGGTFDDIPKNCLMIDCEVPDCPLNNQKPQKRMFDQTDGKDFDDKVL